MLEVIEKYRQRMSPFIEAEIDLRSYSFRYGPVHLDSK